MTTTLRFFFRHISTAALLLFLSMGAAWAARPVVEIIAFAHPPVQSALKPLRDWLAEKRLVAIGLTGHIPIVVLVDGKFTFTRKDGSIMEFKSFPAGPGTPTGVKGTWSMQDVQAVLKDHKP
jgi:hypothetical protein